MFLLGFCSGVMQVDRVCYTVISDTPLNYLCNLAVYLSGARVSIFSTLVTRLLIFGMFMESRVLQVSWKVGDARSIHDFMNRS